MLSPSKTPVSRAARLLCVAAVVCLAQARPALAMEGAQNKPRINRRAFLTGVAGLVLSHFLPSGGHAKRGDLEPTKRATGPVAFTEPFWVSGRQALPLTIWLGENLQQAAHATQVDIAQTVWHGVKTVSRHPPRGAGHFFTEGHEASVGEVRLVLAHSDEHWVAQQWRKTLPGAALPAEGLTLAHAAVVTEEARRTGKRLAADRGQQADVAARIVNADIVVFLDRLLYRLDRAPELDGTVLAPERGGAIPRLTAALAHQLFGPAIMSALSAGEQDIGRNGGVRQHTAGLAFLERWHTAQPEAVDLAPVMAEHRARTNESQWSGHLQIDQSKDVPILLRE